MTYRLKFDEPLGKGWRRIVREQIEQATVLLGSGQDVDGAVHETRKSMKRVRALLKLLRPGLSASDYKRENRRYRKIARVLSGARDRAVLMATAEMLSNETTGEARVAADALLIEISRGKASGVPDRDSASMAAAGSLQSEHIGEALAALEAAAKSLGKLRFNENSFAIVRRGIERSYRNARNDMTQALESGVDEDFHVWRKSVQAHWRHMLLIGRAWPDLFAARAQLAREMSDLLGLDHDLFMLIGYAKSLAMLDAEADGRDVVVGAARQRQNEIRKELEIKAAALFAEPSSRFVASVDAYWRAAKGACKLEKRRTRAKAKTAPSLAGAGKNGSRTSARAGGGAGAKPANARRPAPVKRGAKAGAGADQGSAAGQVSKPAVKKPVARRRAERSKRGGPDDKTPSGKA